MSDDKYFDILPTRIRELVSENNITQNALAKEIGVTRQAISQYCDGSSVPNADKLLKLVQFFNVSADYLLGVTDAKTNDKDVQFISDYTGLNESVIVALADSEMPNYIAQLLNLLSKTYKSEYLCKSVINYLNTENLEIKGSDSFEFGNLDCIANAPRLNWLFYTSKPFGNSGEITTSVQAIDNQFWANYFMMEIQKTLIEAKKELKSDI